MKKLTRRYWEQVPTGTDVEWVRLEPKEYSDHGRTISAGDVGRYALIDRGVDGCWVEFGDNLLWCAFDWIVPCDVPTSLD